MASKLARLLKLKNYKEGNIIEFEVKREDNFYNVKPQTVTYTLKTEGPEVRCSCDDASRYCIHMIATLDYACKIKSNPQFFWFLDESHRLEKKKQFALRYGVEDDSTNSWDEYYYNVAIQAARNSKCFSRKIYPNSRQSPEVLPALSP